MSEVTFLDGAVRLIQGDCRDILPTLGKVDAVVTDPPYGIGSTWKGGFSCKRTARQILLPIHRAAVQARASAEFLR